MQSNNSEIEPLTTNGATQPPAALIVNADDWGLSRMVTDRIRDCLVKGAISSTSAMVFMQDSERAAELARSEYFDTGLHLNLTTDFSGANVGPALREHVGRVAKFLRLNRFAATLYNPWLANSFEYLVKAQLEEYERLYGDRPGRIDGHHHRHRATNVLWQKLLPAGVIVRRNFTFTAAEKGPINRWYRRREDHALKARHSMADYLFNVTPLENRARLKRIVELGRTSNVEIETHPGQQEEYDFLMAGKLLQVTENVVVLRGYQLRERFGAEAQLGPLAEELTHEHARADAELPHICVCVCTYKRPEPLRRLLKDLDHQDTNDLFTVSVVVADNDPEGSARETVEAIQKELRVAVKYCAEPQRGIARARNKVVANATGDYLAWIDDDEFPAKGWLVKLYMTCRRYGVDGVLGPVQRYFDHEPPAWLRRSRLYERRANPTGQQVQWKESRTGNVLIRREVVAGDPAPFRVEFRAGEDQDFFRRKIAEGRRFVWSADAVAYEVIPPARWKRMYYVRKALFQGATSAMHPNTGAKSIAKSVIAVPLYTLGLPLALMAGQHRFMTLLVKLCDHAGKLLHILRIHPIGDEYVSE